jgi:CIC family chloride channel protein
MSDAASGGQGNGLRVFVLGETQRLLLLSTLIGVFAGLLIVCFHIAMEAIGWGTIARFGGGRVALVLWPAAGAVAGVFIVARLFPSARGSGVSDTKSAVYISDGYIPFSAVIGKFFACAIAIGTGNSLGPEDPSLHMGAGMASVLGRSFRLSRESMRAIAPVGAAAGLAAAFNTPITAVLFVIEEVLSGWNAGVLGSIMLAAVSAVVVERWFLGNQPLFAVPQFELTNVSELVVYAIVGVLGGLLSVLFIKAVRYLRMRVDSLPRDMRYRQPAAAGMVVGFAGLWLPQVLGAGYPAIDSALHDRYGWALLLLLGGAKIVVTLLCFSAHIPGGMFAPALFTGAMIGGGIGGLAHLYWPFPTSPASAYVLVGMGTFFAGVFRAPMTSIFMVFEVSASYVIILPVMIANTISYLISRKLQPEAFFALVAEEDGLELPSMEEQREEPALRVEDAMSPPIPVLDAGESVRAAKVMLRENEGVFMESGDGLWTYITEADIAAAKPDGLLEAAVPVAPLPRVYPDVSLDSALRLLGSHRVLPVASRTRPFTLIGLLTLGGIERAYGIERQPEQKRPIRAEG